MYGEPDDDYMHEEEESEDIPTEMWQESAWSIISAFFEEKGKETEIKNSRLVKTLEKWYFVTYYTRIFRDIS